MKSTTKWMSAAGIVATGLVSTGLVFAQPPGPRPRAAAATGTTTTPTTRFDAVKTYLTLTDAQIAAIQVIEQAARTASQPYAEQLRTKDQALRAALRATPIVATTVTALQADIKAIQAQITKVHTDAQTQAVNTLTVDQKTKLAALTAAEALQQQIRSAAALGLLTPPEGGPGFPGGRGPGGPGGRGPGGRGPGGPRGQ